MTAPQNPADADARSWVAHAPLALQPYLQLARLDRPIGTWLLFWPCVWGVLLARPNDADWRPTLVLVALLALGSIAMRGAGCAYNDIVDRHIDAQVARTAGRPLPSGRVSLRGAWIFVSGLCGVGLLVLVQLNHLAMGVALGSVLLVAAYPFMKRITWWPQAWLGLTFNWGALVGFAAVADAITLPALLIYAVGIFWTLGYDSIYAFQDIDDDALVGVKSSARALGVSNARRGVGLFYGLAVILLATGLCMAAHNIWYGFAVLPVAGHFVLQVKSLDASNAACCLALFRSNRDAGALIALACAAVLI